MLRRAVLRGVSGFSHATQSPFDWSAAESCAQDNARVFDDHPPQVLTKTVGTTLTGTTLVLPYSRTFGGGMFNPQGTCEHQVLL